MYVGAVGGIPATAAVEGVAVGPPWFTPLLVFFTNNPAQCRKYMEAS